MGEKKKPKVTALIVIITILILADGPTSRRETQAASITGEQTPTLVLEPFSASPAVFIENTGQIENTLVRYFFRGSGVNVYHTTQGVVFQLFKEDWQTKSYAFSAHFVGAKEVRPTGADPQQTKINYYLGGEPNNWRTNVPTYGKVVYPDVFEGIDLHTFGRRSHLKYEFHVRPGADYSQIVVGYDGIDGLSIDNQGRLHVQTPLGELIDDAPVIRQTIDGEKNQIQGRYRLLDKTSFTFEIAGKIDPNAELIIDPDLAWAGFLGASGYDDGRGIAVDSAGNVLLTGYTASADFPASGGFDANYNGGYGDAFVAKVSGSGQLIWASFLGASNDDYGAGIAVDSAGNALLTGGTWSADFPTSGGFDTSYNGGCDAFVAKVSGSGRLIWASFLGGGASDSGKAIAVDSAGDALLTGYTGSTDFPASGGLDTSYNGGRNDAFVAKVTSSGRLAWAGFLGGSAYDEGRGIAVDSAGNALLTGNTESADFPASGGFDTGYSGGGWDAFVAKVSGSGQLVWAGFLGASSVDWGNGIAVDSTGNALLTGYTESADFPAPGGFDTSHNGSADAFVAKVSGSGRLIWASFLGASSGDEGCGIAGDSAGNALLTGSTESTNFPAPGGFDTSHNGLADAFVAKVTSSGRLAWASYIGGSNPDSGYGIAVDSTGNALLTGYTSSADFPAPGGFDATHNGSTDAFAAKISVLPSPPPPNPDKPPVPAPIEPCRPDVRPTVLKGLSPAGCQFREGNNGFYFPTPAE